MYQCTGDNKDTCSRAGAQQHAVESIPTRIMHRPLAAAVLALCISRAMAMRKTAPPPGLLPPFAGLTFAPPLNLEKWDTMQSKRVQVQILYTTGEDKDEVNHERTFLRTKRVLQDRYPDVRVEGIDVKEDDTFKILVDAKAVYSKPREREGVYLSTKVLDKEIGKARSARRPTTNVYGGADNLENFSDGRAAADVPKYD